LNLSWEGSALELLADNFVEFNHLLEDGGLICTGDDLGPSVLLIIELKDHILQHSILVMVFLVLEDDGAF